MAKLLLAEFKRGTSRRLRIGLKESGTLEREIVNVCTCVIIVFSVVVRKPAEGLEGIRPLTTNSCNVGDCRLNFTFLGPGDAARKSNRTFSERCALVFYNTFHWWKFQAGFFHVLETAGSAEVPA
jgi:hypothetical protein